MSWRETNSLCAGCILGTADGLRTFPRDSEGGSLYRARASVRERSAVQGMCEIWRYSAVPGFRKYYYFWAVPMEMQVRFAESMDASNFGQYRAESTTPRGLCIQYIFRPHKYTRYLHGLFGYANNAGGWS